MIFTKRLKPSADLRSSLLEMFWQNSLALVLESTSKACRFHTKLFGWWLITHPVVIWRHIPRLYHQGNTLYGRSGWFCVGWPLPPPGEEGTSEIHCCHQQCKHVDIMTLGYILLRVVPLSYLRRKHFSEARRFSMLTPIPVGWIWLTYCTVEPCAAFACSLQREGGVSLTEGNVGCVATICCWEGTDQYTTKAAPILSPRCTWNGPGPKSGHRGTLHSHVVCKGSKETLVPSLPLRWLR